MGFLKIPEMIKHEGEQGAIPYILPPTNLLISLLPAPQLEVKKKYLESLKV